MPAREAIVEFQPKQDELRWLLRRKGSKAATWIGYGGSRGGGKSKAIRDCAIELAAEIEPGVTIWILRRVFDDVQQNHVEKFFSDWPEIRELYTVSDHTIHFENRSKIRFMYAETKEDLIRKFHGPEAKYIFVDQAEQFSAEELQYVHSSNREAGSAPGDCKTVLCFNPGGPGTEFLRRIFFLKRYKEEEHERPEDFAFIQAYGWDNYEWFRGIGIKIKDFYRMPSDARFQLFITQTDYGRKLNALPPALRLGELLGSFEHFAGQYFSGVWDEETCVIDSRLADEIMQPWWTQWMAQDWGFGDHDAHGWFASGKVSPADWMKYFGGETEWPMDVVILHRAYIINNRAEADLAMDIVDRTPEGERRNISRFFLSQDAFGQRARQFGAHSVGEQFSNVMKRYGLPSPEPADQDRINGWRFMYNCLRQANLRGQIITKERAQEGPAFFVSTECPDVISSIPLAVRDEDEREDVLRVPGVLWEDVTDMCRYGLKSMLDPKHKVPLSVRREMVYASHEDMNARAMALRHFDANENRRTHLNRAVRAR